MEHFVTYVFAIVCAAVGILQLSKSNRSPEVFAVLFLSYALSNSASHFSRGDSLPARHTKAAATETVLDTFERHLTEARNRNDAADTL